MWHVCRSLGVGEMISEGKRREWQWLGQRWSRKKVVDGRRNREWMGWFCHSLLLLKTGVGAVDGLAFTKEVEEF
ncbi:hypothetical protein Nepgr_010579 [Nepenthes gracilis]|uniref:Uncharacterized protein n=1 Tax=Nepenthes gracilis TaxID=150966 RepID=A0AAD3SD75_NEPGR|nr:hypothetical protein Nepgr_010579 [Nepenthes gracilis]